MNIVKEMIDIGDATSLSNNSDARAGSPPAFDSAIDSIPFIASNGNDFSDRSSWQHSAYANGFDVETIALLVMFIVCAAIYGSKY